MKFVTIDGLKTALSKINQTFARKNTVDALSKTVEQAVQMGKYCCFLNYNPYASNAPLYAKVFEYKPTSENFSLNITFNVMWLTSGKQKQATLYMHAVHNSNQEPLSCDLIWGTPTSVLSQDILRDFFIHYYSVGDNLTMELWVRSRTKGEAVRLSVIDSNISDADESSSARYYQVEMSKENLGEATMEPPDQGVTITSQQIAGAPPVSHSSTDTTYGTATTTSYGHVKATNGNGLTISNGTIAMSAASTSQPGAVQLNNTLLSTLTTQALTAAQGKVLNDSITTLKTQLLDAKIYVVKYTTSNSAGQTTYPLPSGVTTSNTVVLGTIIQGTNGGFYQSNGVNVWPGRTDISEGMSGYYGRPATTVLLKFA